jgi:hypothetical protein
VLPDNKAASSRIARNRNVNANSESAKNKVVNRAVAANRVVAVNRVVSKADDKPGYLEKESGGRRLPPLCLSVHNWNHALPLLRVR